MDEALDRNRAYARVHGRRDLAVRPRRALAIVTCMDSRLDVFAALGLAEGDAHVLRNAGGIVTDDTIRSLALSQRLLGTEAVMLIHHTDCGLERVTEEGFRAELARAAGAEPPFEIGAFSDVDDSVRRSIARVAASPFLPRRDRARGFVYDVTTGELREVRAEAVSSP
ncbi:MAG: carbonic anhydrase [Chloroflexi bacterium]|nr:carbonic anhydrase [Chloroflexota bacterium]